jgi:hypothetical protein
MITGRKKLTEISQLVFATEMIFIVVVYVSKIAVGLLLHRLASQKFKRTYAVAVIAACGACCLASVLAVAIQDVGTPWLSSRKNARSMVSGFGQDIILSADHAFAEESMDSLRRHEQSPRHLPLGHPSADNP